MVKRGAYKKSTRVGIGLGGRKTDQKKGYLPKDNKRVSTLLILNKNGPMNQNRLQLAGDLKRGHWQKYNNILKELENWGFLKSEISEYHATVKMYDLTDKGKDLANAIITLVDNYPELENFETFFGKKP